MDTVASASGPGGGLVASLTASLALRGDGVRSRGLLIACNAVGAFDYAHGLLTQRLAPTVTQSAVLTSGSIGVSLCVQLVVVGLLHRSDVVGSFAAGLGRAAPIPQPSPR